MTQANDERAARKQYIRRRQKVVFTITGTILTIALVISLLFFFHVGGLGNVKSAAVQPNYGQQAPCAAQEQDGSKTQHTEEPHPKIKQLATHQTPRNMNEVNTKSSARMASAEYTTVRLIELETPSAVGTAS